MALLRPTPFQMRRGYASGILSWQPSGNSRRTVKTIDEISSREVDFMRWFPFACLINDGNDDDDSVYDGDDGGDDDDDDDDDDDYDDYDDYDDDYDDSDDDGDDAGDDDDDGSDDDVDHDDDDSDDGGDDDDDIYLAKLDPRGIEVFYSSQLRLDPLSFC